MDDLILMAGMRARRLSNGNLVWKLKVNTKMTSGVSLYQKNRIPDFVKKGNWP